MTVYRTYENGLYRYEDDYGEILKRPSYEEQVRIFAEQYLPSEGIKIYTEIKDGGNGAADGESFLKEVSAVTYIFMDEALCSGQYETFLEAVPDWLTENCQGVPAGIYLRMAESEAWKQIGRSDYEDKLREDIYTEEAAPGRYLYRRGGVRDIRERESDRILAERKRSYEEGITAYRMLRPCMQPERMHRFQAGIIQCISF